ncbi:MAG: DUF1573 domain-containing protein [Bacteroidia bacterium]
MIIRIGTIFLSLCFILCCSFQKENQDLHFKTRHHHFGFIHQGKILEYDYMFTNLGSKPLQILGTEAECICTKAEFPSKPVNPGESGIIHLRFDSGKAMGRQERTIQVFTNLGSAPVRLVFKCIVLKKKE